MVVRGLQVDSYRSFGMQMEARVAAYVNKSYKYGFNGKEGDVESFSQCVAFEARIYDSRLARFLSTDPLEFKFVYQSTYVFAANSPIKLVDLLGMSPGDPIKKQVQANQGPTQFGYQHGVEGADWVEVASSLADMNLEAFPYYNSEWTYDQKKDFWANEKGTKWNIDPGQSLVVGYESDEDDDDPITPKPMPTAPEDPEAINRVAIAHFLRNSPVLPSITKPYIMANPFFKAEAIVGDYGWGLVGAEGDRGAIFILAGPDIGKIVYFDEYAGGVGTSAGGTLELGRIDYDGPQEDLNIHSFYGARIKAWAEYGALGSIGMGQAWGYHPETNKKMTTTTYSISLGLGTLISGGVNTGDVVPKGAPRPRY